MRIQTTSGFADIRLGDGTVMKLSTALARGLLTVEVHTIPSDRYMSRGRTLYLAVDGNGGRWPLERRVGIKYLAKNKSGKPLDNRK